MDPDIDPKVDIGVAIGIGPIPAGWELILAPFSSKTSRVQVQSSDSHILRCTLRSSPSPALLWADRGSVQKERYVLQLKAEACGKRTANRGYLLKLTRNVGICHVCSAQYWAIVRRRLSLPSTTYLDFFFLFLSRLSLLTSKPCLRGGLWLLHGLVSALPSEASPARRPPLALDHFPSWNIKGLLVLQGHESWSFLQRINPRSTFTPRFPPPSR